VQERGGTLTLPHFRLSNTLRTLNPHFFTLHRRQRNMTIHGRTGLCCPIAGSPVDRRERCRLRGSVVDLNDVDQVSGDAVTLVSHSSGWRL
jgi:hypothetical protein